MTPEEINTFLAAVADGFRSMRSPILHTPAEAGLDFEDVTFPSRDGVPLEGWFIPAPGATKVIIANHPLWFNRAGLPSHLEPWKSHWAPTGNDVEVTFIPDYRILHDAGYHVLAYDMRNFGLSGSANGGVISGIFEARDVLGSLDWVRAHPGLRDAAIGLLSRCMGANATLFAMRQDPAAFHDVRCLVAPQPLSPRITLEQTLTLAGVDAAAHMPTLESLIRLHNSAPLDDLSPVGPASSVTVPTLLYQVRDDVLTRPSDVQAVFDAIPIDDKDLFWIEGSTRRWDGYLHFAQHPARALAWFADHMK
ncbi:alpha/beta hydrolase [Catenuloplanes japonicus]|uniref:alpha/beta hydrolase n=1 Tax=Catenuloplanes japonicus TaxID=33876 RepID=UPI0005271B07|nr:alpha/beta hydrolase [Catenuloplanes japonicus]